MVAEFWSQLLDVPSRPINLPGWFRVGPTVTDGPVITLQPVPERKKGRARLHLDVWVGDLDAAVDLVSQIGGTSTGETHGYEDGRGCHVRPRGQRVCLVAALRQ
jgi:hypothetical protein